MSKISDRLWADIRAEISAQLRGLQLSRAYVDTEYPDGVTLMTAAGITGIERVPRLHDGQQLSYGDEVVVAMIGGRRVVLGAIQAATDRSAFAQMADYIASRGPQLVTNYTGMMRSNYNFAPLAYDPSQFVTGYGSFRADSAITTVLAQESIAVDTANSYELSCWAKGSTGTGRFYLGFTCRDADGLEMIPYNYNVRSGTGTTLAADLKPGDTTIQLTSSAGWQNAGADHERTIALFGYRSAGGFLYPGYSYTRNVLTNAWAAAGINTTTHVITLRAPWPDAMGTFAAGTPVANTASAGVYRYAAASNVLLSTSWQKFTSPAITGESANPSSTTTFVPYTSTIAPIMLTNRSAADTQWINAVAFRRL